MTLKDHQRPCRFVCVIWKQNKMPLATANDPERLSMTDSKFGPKSSNLNDNFERPLRPGFHYTTIATTTTQKQSDYKVGQSSFTLIALFSLEIGCCHGRNWLNGNQA